MTRTQGETHKDVVSALILLGGRADAKTLKAQLLKRGYTIEDAELAIQRSTDGQCMPVIKIANDLAIELEDDLPARCQEVLVWRQTGIYSGYLLEAHGQTAIQAGHCREDEGVLNAEHRTIKEALTRLAGDIA